MCHCNNHISIRTPIVPACAIVGDLGRVRIGAAGHAEQPLDIITRVSRLTDNPEMDIDNRPWLDISEDLHVG